MNPLIKLAVDASPGAKRYILFAGAGVSKDAGLPTAWDLMLETAKFLYANEHENPGQVSKVALQEWFEGSAHAEREYAEIMDDIFPRPLGQQEFLQTHLGGRKPGKAHKGIAELARRGIIRAVVTTNFDHCIEEALSELGLAHQVIVTEDDVEQAEPLIHCQAVRIYKPHGDLGKGVLKNTPRDLKELGPRMKEELIRVLSDHGVIVVGYQGADEGIREVFKARNSLHFRVFWVHRSPWRAKSIDGAMGEILRGQVEFVGSRGASDFTREFLSVYERLEQLAPEVAEMPAMHELRDALKQNRADVQPLYSEYLEGIYEALKATRPDFSAFDHGDDAIIDQIEKGLPISVGFVEAAREAIRFDASQVFETIYQSFGRLLPLAEVRDDWTGPYRDWYWDGFGFLLREMFLSFIALMLKQNQWDDFGWMLKQDLFVGGLSGSYKPHAAMSGRLTALDVERNRRLQLRFRSLTAELFERRFEETALANLVGFEACKEADYFLYLWSICAQDGRPDRGRQWYPSVALYLKQAPRFIQQMESQRYLKEFVRVFDPPSEEVFLRRLSTNRGIYEELWSPIDPGISDPLGFFAANSFGKRP